MSKSNQISHLAIGDVHSETRVPSEPRAGALRKHILGGRPDKIIFIGDFIDFGSLSMFDKPGSKEKEGLRVREEVDHGLAMFRTMLDTSDSHWPKNYRPEVFFTKGNHEHRLERLMENQAIFDGIVDLEADFTRVADKLELPFTWSEYGKYQIIDGISYTHVPFKNGQPVASTVNHTGMSLQLVDGSVVYGHTHRLEVKQALRAPSFKLITALNIGCYFSHIPKYVKASNPHWWRGVVDIFPDGRGGFDFRTTSMEAML